MKAWFWHLVCVIVIVALLSGWRWEIGNLMEKEAEITQLKATVDAQRRDIEDRKKEAHEERQRILKRYQEYEDEIVRIIEGKKK